MQLPVMMFQSTTFWTLHRPTTRRSSQQRPTCWSFVAQGRVSLTSPCGLTAWRWWNNSNNNNNNNNNCYYYYCYCYCYYYYYSSSSSCCCCCCCSCSYSYSCSLLGTTMATYYILPPPQLQPMYGRKGAHRIKQRASQIEEAAGFRVVPSKNFQG